jgi:hypothetical protein
MHSAATEAHAPSTEMHSAATEAHAPSTEMHSATARVETTTAAAEVSATAAEVSTAAPRCLRGQGSGERHHRGQYDCANCRSAIFHEHLLREVSSASAEKSDGPSQNPC